MSHLDVEDRETVTGPGARSPGAAVEAVAAHTPAEAGVRGRTWVQLVVGEPALLLDALAAQADLLVLGTHARS